MAEEEEIVETDPYCTSDRFAAKNGIKAIEVGEDYLSASCQSMKLASMVLAFLWVVATLPLGDFFLWRCKPLHQEQHGYHEFTN